MSGTSDPNSGDLALRLRDILNADPNRMRILADVARLETPTCWVGAGFVRGAVWDYLHGYPASPGYADVDVIWFDPHCLDAAADHAIEARLRARDATVPWSVKNQARMHIRNDDPPYASIGNAIARWPETATSVAARLTHGAIEVLAPHGLEDLFGLILRPTPAFATTRRAVFHQRITEKRWLARWPRLRVIA